MHEQENTGEVEPGKQWTGLHCWLAALPIFISLYTDSVIYMSPYFHYTVIKAERIVALEKISSRCHLKKSPEKV